MVEKITKWLSIPGNTKPKLAALLGYRSSATIDNWIRSGKVPDHMESRVKTILKENK